MQATNFEIIMEEELFVDPRPCVIYTEETRNEDKLRDE